MIQRIGHLLIFDMEIIKMTLLANKMPIIFAVALICAIIIYGIKK